MFRMKPLSYAFRAALLGSALVAPTSLWADQAVPSCSDLATNPNWGLAGNPSITGLTAVVIPVGPGVTTAYCQVNFTDVTLVGPDWGYLPGQTSKIRIRVGLPLSAADGGTGGAQGAWNGNVESLGNGGFAGSVVGVTTATNLGYVGTGTDTGHNAAITNAIPNPTPPPTTVQEPPSEASAAFGLNVDGTINYGRIMDFTWRGEHHANLWGRAIAKTYYGQKHNRNYFVGCSDGGREAHEMAERFGQDFDGIVALSPAVGWHLQQFSGGWGNYVAHQELGTDGVKTAKFVDVNARALAACDAIDGITDGLIEDTRKCHYDANAAVCGQSGASADPTKCLTTAEAAVVNKIWDGPRDASGNKVWYGWERGQGGVLGITSDTTGFPNLFGEALNRYWVHKDPTMNWRTISETQFLVEQQNLSKQFSQYMAADDPNLHTFKGSGGKILVAFGNQDQVIPPRGLYNYVQRVFAKMGGVSETQDFYRYYVFPGATHCGGSGMSTGLLFDALVKWVENGVAPDYLVAQVNPTRTRKVCMYPNTQLYNGSGSTDDEANFHCQVNAQDDPALLQADIVTGHGEGPLKGNHDIGNLP